MAADEHIQRVLLLAAHPNDEFGVAATLRAHHRAGDEVFCAWFARDDRDEIGDMRRAEATKAMQMIGVSADHLLFPYLEARELTGQLPELVEAIRSVIEGIDPDRVYVPAFEGGHPEHDAVNFAAWEAVALKGVEVFEFPIYHATKRRVWDRLPVFGHMLPGVGDTAVKPLTPRETRFKRLLWKVYRSQRPLFDVLLRASGDDAHVFTTEELRPLPLRDYMKPPHERPLLYELHPDMPYSFDEFSSAIRRYHWSGGTESADSWDL